MKKKGVSPTVIITVVAVIAVVAVGIGIYVGTRGSEEGGGGLGGGALAPSATLSITAAWSGSGITLTISHMGGDALALSDLTVKVGDTAETATNTATFTHTTGTLSVGGIETATWSGASTTDNVIVVKIIHNPSSQLIYSKSDVSVG